MRSIARTAPALRREISFQCPRRLDMHGHRTVDLIIRRTDRPAVGIRLVGLQAVEIENLARTTLPLPHARIGRGWPRLARRPEKAAVPQGS
jgi:hypothetical protein